MKAILHSVIFICLTFFFSSCRSLYTSLLGMKMPVSATEDDIIRYAKKYKIPAEDCYELDSNYFLFYHGLNQRLPEKETKDLGQPLQARYYDVKNNRLQSFHINCYADRGTVYTVLSGLDWNKEGRLKSFPPLQSAPIDTFLSLPELLSFMMPLKTTSPISINDYDYVVVVYWNMFMQKHSRKLIKKIKKNVILARGQNVKILYANNENLYSGHYNRNYTVEDLTKYGIDFKKLMKAPSP